MKFIRTYIKSSQTDDTVTSEHSSANSISLLLKIAVSFISSPRYIPISTYT